MKLLLFTVLFFLAGATVVAAQSNAWFLGTWYGERSFPRAAIAIRTPVRMDVYNIDGSLFTAKFIYMYPSDTATRLERIISGKLYGKYVIITKSKETYRMDERSRSFWSDCSKCPGSSSFYIENNEIILKIETTGCGDSCNGETVFRRKLYTYDSVTQTAIFKQLNGAKDHNAFRPFTNTPDSVAYVIKMAKIVAIKYFPVLLKGDMSLHFDPNKYVIKTTASGNAASSEKTIAQPKSSTDNITSSAIKKSSERKNDSAAVSIKTAKTPQRSLSDDVQSSLIKKTFIQKNDSVVISKKAVKKTTPAHTIEEKNPVENIAKKSDEKALKDSAEKVVITKPAIKTEAEKLPVAAQKDTANTAAQNAIKDTIPAAITERTTNLITTYEVSSPNIFIQLFDDGQIDGDAVSVYYNGKLIVDNQQLTHKAIVFELHASATNRHHEFVLISESEGLVAPNTALMRLTAGTQKFELTVNSNMQHNAKIAIDYTGD